MIIVERRHTVNSHFDACCGKERKGYRIRNTYIYNTFFQLWSQNDIGFKNWQSLSLIETPLTSHISDKELEWFVHGNKESAELMEVFLRLLYRNQVIEQCVNLVKRTEAVVFGASYRPGFLPSCIVWVMPDYLNLWTQIPISNKT